MPDIEEGGWRSRWERDDLKTMDEGGCPILKRGGGGAGGNGMIEPLFKLSSLFRTKGPKKMPPLNIQDATKATQ
jgi:hypothetical protein